MLTSEQIKNDSNVPNSKKSSPRYLLISHENTFPKAGNIFYAIEVKENITTAMSVR